MSFHIDELSQRYWHQHKQGDVTWNHRVFPNNPNSENLLALPQVLIPVFFWYCASNPASSSVVAIMAGTSLEGGMLSFCFQYYHRKLMHTSILLSFSRCISKQFNHKTTISPLKIGIHSDSEGKMRRIGKLSAIQNRDIAFDNVLFQQILNSDWRTATMQIIAPILDSFYYFACI